MGNSKKAASSHFDQTIKSLTAGISDINLVTAGDVVVTALKPTYVKPRQETWLEPRRGALPYRILEDPDKRTGSRGMTLTDGYYRYETHLHYVRRLFDTLQEAIDDRQLRTRPTLERWRLKIGHLIRTLPNKDRKASKRPYVVYTLDKARPVGEEYDLTTRTFPPHLVAALGLKTAEHKFSNGNPYSTHEFMADGGYDDFIDAFRWFHYTGFTNMYISAEVEIERPPDVRL